MSPTYGPGANSHVFLEGVRSTLGSGDLVFA
jgi:hypothetical protein